MFVLLKQDTTIHVKVMNLCDANLQLKKWQVGRIVGRNENWEEAAINGSGDGELTDARLIRKEQAYPRRDCLVIRRLPMITS